MKLFNKLCAYVLIASIGISSTAHAETYETNTDASMAITTMVASKWEVSIPSANSFSTVDKQSTYEISIAGDVADNSMLQVIPDSTVTLTNESGNNSVELTVTQATQSWLGSEISDTPITVSGLIKAPQDSEFSAGQYSGTLNFRINCIEDEDITQQVYDTMRSLNFYGAGDSLMEGYGNNYVGLLDSLHDDYGIKISKDYSIAGARITKVNTNGIIDIQTQISNALARIEAEGYKDNTVLIFDGGGNDAIAAAKGEPISFSDMDDPNKDIGMAFATIWGAITGMQDSAGVNAPVVYIIPKLNDAGMESCNAGLQSTILSLKSAVSDDPRLIIIDCNDILTADADLQEDGVHLTSSGYKKVNRAITMALYDYYN